MESRSSREAGVWKQTRSLLYKNMLIKWRTKQQSVQEVILPLVLLGLLILISTINPHVYHAGFSTVALEREVLLSFTTVGYTPISNITTRIMEEAAHLLRSLDADVVLEMFSTEQQLENASLFAPSSFVGVVFQNGTSYQLRFPFKELPLPSDYTESIASCVEDSTNCRATSYWDSGFIRLQSCIDAAIIQHRCCHHTDADGAGCVGSSVADGGVDDGPARLALPRRRSAASKDFMRLMGLRDSAFWLSWGLLYAALVSIMAVLMSAIATCTALFPNSHFILIFLIIFLYGISSIFYSFMVTPLFQRPKLASTVGSLLTLVLGCLSLLTVLIRDFPQPLVWVLCLLSPAAFSIAIAQVVFLEAHGICGCFPPLYTPLLMLLLDSVLYLLLALYLDQVLPGEFGSRRPFLYFLKPSYWSRGRRQCTEARDGELSGSPLPPDSAHPTHPIEPVSPEFRGREAIRISNLRKVYNETHTPVEALRGISFDIYEGQITALLGHSGAGKSTLINILCGISAPSDGRASVYGWLVCQGVEARQLVGICPQFNVQFDVLTVEEHLRVFAAIKGVPAAEMSKH
ncbi:hypothetical protein GJAV_G00141500 [Gymnothorax javanicus]|nr:hypothetical protein GJAV_G00141500 [Gymnothorax javanicus]